MRTAALKTNKKGETRAAAHATLQQKKNQKDVLGAAYNRPGPAAALLKSVPYGPARGTGLQRFKSPPPLRTNVETPPPLQRKINNKKQKTAENPGSTNNDKTIQRVIINTGGDDLVTELRSDTGWIIASDIQVALKEGGAGQDIFELDRVPAGYTLPVSENIYLVGHGAPGLLGAETPAYVKTKLNPIIPAGYKGYVRSLSCSAGEGGAASAVADLAKDLIDKITVKGAAGVALNHPVYEGGVRVIPHSKWDSVARPIVDKYAKTVTDKWKRYVKFKTIKPEEFNFDAGKAELISEEFYEDLETALEAAHCLLPKGSDITTKTKP